MRGSAVRASQAPGGGRSVAAARGVHGLRGRGQRRGSHHPAGALKRTELAVAICVQFVVVDAVAAAPLAAVAAARGSAYAVRVLVVGVTGVRVHASAA